MRAAVIGPLCKDVVIIKNKSRAQPGGVTYYSGCALNSLGIDTTVICSLGKNDRNLLNHFPPSIRIKTVYSAATIKFVNEYPSDDPNLRIQRAEIYPNVISVADLKKFNLNGYDYVVLGPLFHDNISARELRYLSKLKPKPRIVIAPQGLLRHLEGGKIIFKNPETVLDLVKFTDYIFVDEEEFEFLTGTENYENGLKMLNEIGAKNIIITLGSKGSLVYADNKITKIKAHPPKILKDPTGAGDSYLAGFIKGLELFDKPKKVGDFAAMTATISLENKGPFNKSTDEVLKRLGMGLG